MNSYEILIPFHSNKFFLKTCVDSLLSTTPDNVPITILANNESEAEISIEFTENRINVVKINYSLYYPFCVNYGMQFIKSDNVFIIDADTYHLPGWFESITKLYESCDNIGIIGSALLEMSTNMIRDFGLSFTGYNWVQVYKGQDINSSLIKTRNFQAVCTASCLVNKTAFLSVNGFSEYCNISYSDIDLCIRLAESGYKVLGCADSKVYHKGNASNRIVPLLKKDCYAMFMAKMYNKMKVDINFFLNESYCEYHKKNLISKQYIMLNFSSVINFQWYKEQIENIMNVQIIEIYEYPFDVRDADNINIATVVKTDIYRNHYPFIYFIDLFSALKNNQFWKTLRKNNINLDIVIDRHGTIYNFETLLK